MERCTPNRSDACPKVAAALRCMVRGGNIQPSRRNRVMLTFHRKGGVDGKRQIQFPIRAHNCVEGSPTFEDDSAKMPEGFKVVYEANGFQIDLESDDTCTYHRMDDVEQIMFEDPREAVRYVLDNSVFMDTSTKPDKPLSVATIDTATFCITTRELSDKEKASVIKKRGKTAIVSDYEEIPLRSIMAFGKYLATLSPDVSDTTYDRYVKELKATAATTPTTKRVPKMAVCSDPSYVAPIICNLHDLAHKKSPDALFEIDDEQLGMLMGEDSDDEGGDDDDMEIDEGNAGDDPMDEDTAPHEDANAGSKRSRGDSDSGKAMRPDKKKARKKAVSPTDSAADRADAARAADRATMATVGVVNIQTPADSIDVRNTPSGRGQTDTEDELMTITAEEPAPMLMDGAFVVPSENGPTDVYLYGAPQDREAQLLSDSVPSDIAEAGIIQELQARIRELEHEQSRQAVETTALRRIMNTISTKQHQEMVDREAVDRKHAAAIVALSNTITGVLTKTSDDMVSLGNDMAVLRQQIAAAGTFEATLDTGYVGTNARDQLMKSIGETEGMPVDYMAGRIGELIDSAYAHVGASSAKTMADENQILGTKHAMGEGMGELFTMPQFTL